MEYMARLPPMRKEFQLVTMPHMPPTISTLAMIEPVEGLGHGVRGDQTGTGLGSQNFAVRQYIADPRG